MTLSGKFFLIPAMMLALAACGGGGGGGGDSGSAGGGTTNRAPIASSGGNQSVDEQNTVTLDGSASSDPDGDALTYSWTQTGGVAVALSNAATAQASFEGPDVGIGSSTTLAFQLRVTDTSGATASASVDVEINGVSNSEPVVEAGDDQSTFEGATVALSGSASDSDIGDTLTFSWTQLSGSNVTITNADQAEASFTAPNVGAGGETLTFQFSVDDGTATVTDTIDITVNEAAGVVSVSGKVQYEFVPPNPQCLGLNFLATEIRPIRAATVQLVETTTGSVIGATTANDAGEYAFSNVTGNLDVRIRVRAELKRSSAPVWDVEIRDNVDTSPSPPPLASRPLYVVDFGTFNTGGADVIRNEVATTGWSGSSYTGARTAAPFAILDAIYSAMILVTDVDPNTSFLPLDAFWSVNNTRTGQNDIDMGELTGSFYRPDIDSLFLLGDASVDTEEFDDHVVVHEWGHYFDDTFSRSDSIGGSHFLGESLDTRLAFGEGFAHALAAIALKEPQYCDTGAAATGSGSFGFNTESNNSGLQGWFNELSVATLIYDLWDTDNDGPDDGSIGFLPIYQTMTGPQQSTPAFTTLFSFAAELGVMLNATQRAFLDAQLNRENVDTPLVDIWGDSQLSTPAGARNNGRDLLPIYLEVPTDGSVVRTCINNDYSSPNAVNKLGDFRYLRFTTAATASWTITAEADPVPPPTSDPPPGPDDPPVRDRSDPDLKVFRRSQVVAAGTGPEADREEFTTPALAPDTYVIEMQEWRYEDEARSSDFPTQVCYNLSMVAS